MNHSPEKELALDAVRRLRAAGFEALWAGGCVRDLLLGHEPTDYDVATSATPHQVRDVFGRRRTLTVGLSFGVVIVLGDNSHATQIDVATFRTDATYSDGRRPDAVTFSNPREDAQRRDFTINGMFYDPLHESVIDYVDGQADLQRGVIRAIGHADDRIAEDKLRMLRAIRIAARFGFAIEEQTRAAIQRHAGQVSAVSGERIWMEVRKTLDSPRPAWGVAEWAAVGLLEHILPEVAEDWAATHQETLQLLAASLPLEWPVRLSALLWPAVGAEPRRVTAALTTLRQRLKLANDVCDALQFCLPVQVKLSAAEERPWSEVQPLLIHPYAHQAVSLYELRARTTTSPQTAAPMLATAQWLQQRLAQAPEQLNPPPLLLGSDLIGLGLKPGPVFKDLLEQARRLQLDRALTDRVSALAWVRDQALPGLG